MGDGCTTLDTLTTVCSSTPPLPATGISGPVALVVAGALLALGFIVDHLVRR